jgi:hypothetical protein
MIYLFESQRRPVRHILSVRHTFGAAMALVFATTAAFAQSCAADRTALKMADHTLCLPISIPPSVFKDGDGKVNLLVWSNTMSLPAAAPVPAGTFHLSVDIGQYNSPPLEKTQPSDLPDMRQIIETSSTFLFPLGVEFNGKSFRLQCRDSINPQTALKGGQDCQIDAMIATGLRINVHFGTVVWGNGPAWPRLDKQWINTWPPYLAALGTGINNLLSIQ